MFGDAPNLFNLILLGSADNGNPLPEILQSRYGDEDRLGAGATAVKDITAAGTYIGTPARVMG